MNSAFDKRARARERRWRENPSSTPEIVVKRCTNSRCTRYLNIAKMRYHHRSNSNECKQFFFLLLLSVVCSLDANSTTATWCVLQICAIFIKPFGIRSLCNKSAATTYIKCKRHNYELIAFHHELLRCLISWLCVPVHRSRHNWTTKREKFSRIKTVSMSCLTQTTLASYCSCTVRC